VSESDAQLDTFFSSYPNFNVLDKLPWVDFELELEAFSRFEQKIFSLEFVEKLLELRRLVDFILGTSFGRVPVIGPRTREQARCDTFDFDRNLRVGSNEQVDDDCFVELHLVLHKRRLALDEIGNVVELDGDWRSMVR
jgi:hypothetical protein